MEPKQVRQAAGCAIAGVAYPLMGLLGFVIHVWTIVIAFATKGLLAAILSLMLPVLAQLYWAIVIWSASGTFANPYCLALVGYAGLWVLIIGGFAMASRD